MMFLVFDVEELTIFDIDSSMTKNGNRRAFYNEKSKNVDNKKSNLVEVNRRVVALFLMSLFLFPVAVRGRSNGQGAACNDATATLCNYECPEFIKAWMVPWAKVKDNGRLAPCCPPGMDLVAPPKRSNAYRIHLQGVGTTKKQTLTYKPCEIIEITVYVDVPGMKYLGLLMYAENSEGKKIGFFPVPSGAPVQPVLLYHTCHDGAAIIHSDANMKNYQEKIRWQAPVVGSGPLTLRLLVKHGITQGGAFYWPGTFSYNGNAARVNLTEDLVLSEDGYNKDDSKHRWFVSHKGETCDAACERLGVGSKCDEQVMLDLASKGTPEAQYGPVSKFYTCRLPFLQKPSANGELCLATSTFSVDRDDGWCYWKKPTGQCPISSECSKASDEDGRVCACNNTNFDYTKECPSPLFNGFKSSNVSAEAIDAIVEDIPVDDESSDISNGTEQGGPPNGRIMETKKRDSDFSSDVEEASKSGTGLVIGVAVSFVIVTGIVAVVVYRHWRKKKEANALYSNFKKRKDVGSSSNDGNSNVAVAITVDESRLNPIMLEMTETTTGLPNNIINKRVDTIFGAGTVIEKRDYGSHVIQLDWKLAGGSVAYMYQGQHQKEARDSVALAPPPRGKKRGRKNKLHTTPLMLCFVFVSVLVQGPRCCNAHNWLHNPPSRAARQVQLPHVHQQHCQGQLICRLVPTKSLKLNSCRVIRAHTLTLQ